MREYDIKVYKSSLYDCRIARGLINHILNPNINVFPSLLKNPGINSEAKFVLLLWPSHILSPAF